MAIKGQITIDLDLDDLMAEEEYGTTVGEVVREALRNTIRDEINRRMRSEGNRAIREWTAKYLKGEIAAQPNNVVLVPFPLEEIRK